MSDDAQKAAVRAAMKRIDRVSDWLFLGGAIPFSQYDRLSALGVTHVVDVRDYSEIENDFAGLELIGLRRLHVPVRNYRAPTVQQLDEITRWCPRHSDSIIYVHCIGGIGRGATMAAGLLVERGLSAEEAVQQIKNVRPEIQISVDQMTWLETVAARDPC